MKRNVLILSPGKRGGIDTQAYLLFEGLQNKGFSPTLMRHRPDGEYFVITPSSNFVYTRLEDYKKSNYFTKPDIIHAYTTNFEDSLAGGMSYLLENADNPPVIYSLDWIDEEAHLQIAGKGSESIKPHRRLKHVEAQQNLIRNSRKIITPGTYSLLAAERFYQDHKDKFALIVNGTNFAGYANKGVVAEAADEMKEEIFPERKIILYIGTISPEKGVMELAKATNLIADKYPVSLVFLGKGERKHIDSIKGLTKQKNNKGLKFEGFTYDKGWLAVFYKMSDILVLPTHNKYSDGMSAMEAMVMETPVIASDTGNFTDLFIKPMLAYGIKPGDVEGLAKRLDFLLSNPKQARENAKRVQTIANEKFGVQRFYNEIIKLYESEL